MNNKRRTYEVVLTPDDGGTWMVTVPAIPGCITFGKSIEHAEEMAKDAMSLFLVDEVPEPTTGATAPDGGRVIRLTVDIPTGKKKSA